MKTHLKVKISNYETYLVITDSLRNNNVKWSTETKFNWITLRYFWIITIYK